VAYRKSDATRASRVAESDGALKKIPHPRQSREAYRG